MHVYGSVDGGSSARLYRSCHYRNTCYAALCTFFLLQESKLNLVEGLQKLLEVNGRKDVIRKDYTTY